VAHPGLDAFTNRTDFCECWSIQCLSFY
jgi:hypothetical protein